MEVIDFADLPENALLWSIRHRSFTFLEGYPIYGARFGPMVVVTIAVKTDCGGRNGYNFENCGLG